MTRVQSTRVFSWLTGVLAMALVMGGLVPAAPARAAEDDLDPSRYSGLTSETAAVSCWEIKQLNPDSPDGSYWLLTPEMTAPEQFWCDMTTDGGGWVRVGSGRQQWTTSYDGKGDVSELRQTQPPLTRGVQLGSETIDKLIDGRVDQMQDDIRVRRASSSDGSTWQEVRFQFANRDRWVWSMGAEHRLSRWNVGGVAGTGGQTLGFGSGSGLNYVTGAILAAQSYNWGFAYGSQVAGQNNDATYLWSSADGAGNALPYAEIYIRPRLTTLEAPFAPIGDSGTATIERSPSASSTALVNPWGVAGLAGSTGTEGNVEVQAFEQIGNVMYVGGNFRWAQQDANGAGRVERPFLAAFNATTGQFIPGFAPVLNEQVRTLAALPNGQLLVGGDFTSANGQPAQGLVALNPSTGASSTSWGVRLENGLSPGNVRVEAVDVGADGYVYLGGSFTHLSSADGGNRVFARNAGRVAANNGTPNSWNPEFNGTVLDVSASEDGERAYFSGFFSQSGQSTAFRAAAVMSDTGALDPVVWNPTWSNANKNYQRAIRQHGDRVWVGGSEHSLFDFSTSTYERLGGSITKRGGDFQAIDIRGDQLFAGCHCNNWVYQDAYTWSNVGSSWNQADTIGWIGQWDSSTGDYVPEFTPEFRTRLGSAIWAIEIADDGTVWGGGDVVSGLTTSGSRWLGGFARWAPRDTTAPATPGSFRIVSQTSSTVTLAWSGVSGTSAYQVLRDDRAVATTGGTSLTVPKGGANRFFVRAADAAGNVSASSTVLETGDGNPAPVPRIEAQTDGLTVSLDGSSSSDDGQIVSYTWNLGDGTSSTGATVEHTYDRTGTYQVSLRVRDDQGSFATVTQDVEVSVPLPTDFYGAAVMADEPDLYWRLDETSGTFAQDSSQSDRAGVYQGGVTKDQAGALVDNSGRAASFNGSDGVVVGSPDTAVNDPGEFSVETWFSTTSTRGGKLIGFGNAASGLSSSYDRHIYMRNNGTLTFGVWTGAENTITSTDAYNDGQWHHVVGVQGPAGMALYVDGELVGTHPQTDAQAYTGYWRIGGDRVWSGASSGYLQGSLDEAAVYSTPLSAARVAAHYAAGTAQNAAPTAEFTASTDDLAVSLDASASADEDGEIVGYAWDYGDGETGEGVTTTHTYAEDGTYEVTLTVTDDRGGEATSTQSVSVQGPPNVDPTAQFTTSTDDLAVSLDASASADEDGEIVGYAWDFGDGETGEGVTTTHTYAQAGTYEVTLTVTDDRGGEATTTQDVTVAVQPNIEPTAAFTADTDLLEVSVDASSSVDEDGEIVSYVWDFGDGGVGEGVTAAHTYASAGTYEVTLTVTDDEGAEVSVSEDVTVSESVEPVTSTVIERDASWSWYYGADAPVAAWKDGGDLAGWESGAAPLGFGFPEVTTDIDVDGPTTDRPRAAYFVREFEVERADRVVSLVLDTVADDGAVIYVNGVEVGRQNMREGEVTHFTYAPSARRRDVALADPFVIEVPVDLLVDGTNVVAAETHLNYRNTRDLSFDLDAELTTLGAGASTPNQPPSAGFAVVSDLLEVSVDASSSVDEDGEIVSYVWDFGDGGVGEGVTAAHTYASAGTYEVTLTVTDDEGAEVSVSEDVTVSESVEPVTSTVIERDASWSWYYGADAPVAAWKDGGDLAGWESGAAPLGFGFPEVTTDIDVDGPTTDRPRAAYFVREFEVERADRVVSLVLDTVADDGAVIYVNGVEVGRQNMREGEVTHFTYAPSARRRDVALADPFVIEVPVDLLVDGTNVVAAETHLNYRNTRDLSFDLDAVLTEQPG
ncbi:PKD domain-containing protein [Serinicoccus sediminis]|uniref:PKD domain-containing protein n=1 Tax=Serinicoccus sediminis TaxID=2306021 RepID=UPI001021B76A|nr:PKD domain-containing protein [Serinicoccus sediminis]